MNLLPDTAANELRGDKIMKGKLYRSFALVIVIVLVTMGLAAAAKSLYIGAGQRPPFPRRKSKKPDSRIRKVNSHTST